MSSLQLLKRLGGESVVYGISGVLGRTISIFLVPIYTKAFAPSEYGVIALVLNLMVLLNILAILGLDNSIARWYYDTENESDRLISLNTFLWSCLAFAALMGIGLILLSGVIAQGIFRESAAGPALLVAAVNLPLSVFYTFTWNLLRIERRPWMTTIFTIVFSAVTLGCSVLFVVVLRTGIVGVFYAQICASINAIIWSIVLYGKRVDPRRFSFPRWKEMLLFSLPLLPGSIAFWVVNLSGAYFVQSMRNASEAGLYQIGATLASGAALVTTAFTMAWGPFAYSIHKHDNAKQVYAQVLQAYLGLGCLVSVIMMLFSHEVLLLFANEQYAGAYVVAGILSFNVVLVGLSYIAGIGTGLAKNNRAFGISMLISAGLLVAFNLLLVPRLGKEGAAISTVLSQAIVPLGVFWHAQRLYPIPYKLAKAAAVYLVCFVPSLAGALILISSEISLGASIASRLGVLLFCCGAVFLIVRKEFTGLYDEVAATV